MEIQGYENYLIYPDGRVWSKKSDRYLKQHFYKNHEYLYVALCENNKIKKFKIHRLLALHYIPNPENKPCVDHIDRNRQNNEISNLRWVTISENGQNQKMNKSNTSGHSFIRKVKHKDGNKVYIYWKFQKRINNKWYHRSFKTKTEVLCFKFIFLLKIKCNLIYNE